MDQSTASCSSSPSVFGGGMAGSSSSGAGGGFFMGDSNAGGSQPAHQPQHQQQDEPEVCLVCNDVATGYHYGTPSCNGCKTFFRRTVMKKQVFQCQYDGNCPVDKSVRCACRHCRFKKCLAVGMNKDAIQQNRDPIGYTKRTRRYPLVKQQHALLGSAFNSGGCSTSGTPFPDSSSTPFPGSSSMAMAGCSSTSSASFMNSLGPGPSSSRASQHHQQPQPPMSAEQVQEDLLLQRLINVENILLTIRQNANFLNSKVTMQKSLNDLVLNRSVFEDPELLKQMSSEHFQMPNVLRRAEQQDYLYWHERDWFIMIEWAKCVPVYQELSISDKLALLRHSAITYPSLIQCFYTPDVGPDTIVFPNGAFFDRTLDPNKPTGFQRKNFKMLDNLLNPIRKMQIDQNEFAGAKAVFFLNPDSDADDLSTEAKGRIAVARSAITNALYRYMVQKRGTEEAADKFGKLLLLGTAIATMSCEMKEAVVVADFFDQIRFSGFARQLLLAKDEDDLSAVPTATESPQASAQEQQQQPQHQPQQQQPQNILPQQSQGILHQQQQNILGQHQSQLHVNMHQQQQQQLHNFATHHQAQQQLHLPQSQYQQQLFSTLPDNNINAVANNAVVTLAMLGGLNAQMQQFQQQQQQHHQPQQHGLPSLDFIDLTRGQQQFGMLNDQQEREKQLQQQRQQMIQQIMAAGQQRFQLQQLQQMSHLGQTNLGQKMQTQLGQTQLGQTQLQHQQQSQFHQQQQQTQLGHTQLCQKELGQTQLGPQSAQTTVLPPQDHPLTPGSQQPQQSPSAPSLQSFTNTSPPSLINLT